MENLKHKLMVIDAAFLAFKKSIELFHKYEKIAQQSPTEENLDLSIGMRESMIQRFEYTTDMFWKVLKVYLVDFEKWGDVASSPRGVMRNAVEAKTVTEDEAELCIKMVNARNETSHIYLEDVAEEIAREIPALYTLSHAIIERLKENVQRG